MSCSIVEVEYSASSCKFKDILSKQWTRNSTQSYWVSVLRSSSGILNTRKHNVLETWSLSVFVIHHHQNPLDSTRSSMMNLIFATGRNGIYSDLCDCLCGLVIRVPGYRFRGPQFNSQHYQIFWEVMGLEQGPLNLVSTIGELLERKSSGSHLENWEYVRRRFDALTT
jgi:hypothetical protein